MTSAIGGVKRGKRDMNTKQEIVEREEPPAIVSGPTDPPAPSMLALAIERGMSPEVIGQLITHQERIDATRARKAFDNAMAGARSELPVIAKNRHVGFKSKDTSKAPTDYWHEDLASIARAVDPILAKYGLSYRFRTQSVPGEPVTVTCIIAHRDGHYEENSLSAGRDDTGNKNSIQQVGSTITYLQRYSLKAALGLSAARDDDAQTSEALPSALASEDQVKAMRSAIIEGDCDLEGFLTYAKLERLEDLEASRYPWAMAEITKSAAARAKKKGAAK